MPVLNIYKLDGSQAGTVEVNNEIFGIEPNKTVMHEVLVAELAELRQGTASTKTRAEVRGGGRKPFRQKGTGRARQGSTRAPHMVGGGVVHGPKPRDYVKKVNKKVRDFSGLTLSNSVLTNIDICLVPLVIGFNFLIGITFLPPLLFILFLITFVYYIIF